jgi:biopolymer transport protein TolR
MAGGMDLGTGGGKGKKPLDMMINLVPFIDLMAVTIAFLIMTAVWNQVGRLQVAQAGQNADPEQPQDQPKLPVTLLITEKDLRLSLGGTQFDPIPLIPNEKGKVDLSKLIEKLKEVKTQAQDQNAITLLTEDSVKYEILVSIIDTCVGNEFPSISVSPASS